MSAWTNRCPMRRQQATANRRSFRSLALPVLRRNSSMPCGSSQVSRSASVIKAPRRFPGSQATGEPPPTGTPGDGRWFTASGQGGDVGATARAVPICMITAHQPANHRAARRRNPCSGLTRPSCGRSNVEGVGGQRGAWALPKGGEMKRLHQGLLIGCTVLSSWLGMQAVHESGHVLGAWLTGGRVARVVLHPLTISRTDLAENPHPLAVVWAGPVVGVVLPLLFWSATAAARVPWAFVLRFFAGFCLLANGLYIGVGSFDAVGDCGEMLRHGSESWQLWLFGAATAPVGLWLWH